MTTTTTATIGTLTTAFQHIALSKLVPSAANVRKVNSTAGIGELADSIEAHGLIQNLTVRKAGKGQKFEVVAGARRLAALRLLAKEGRIAKNIDIPCNVLAAERDTEISLAENTQREAAMASRISGNRTIDPPKLRVTAMPLRCGARDSRGRQDTPFSSSTIRSPTTVSSWRA
ncbi:ParB/Srx family N-terminal domain-containing protein [Bosea eneae]|uniref:ParB/Srx family N-terminal domain-containing protein n=1 Tax=Bosea eneae TaxID=151454 RepID=A0ABW0IIP0_9HYPH